MTFAGELVMQLLHTYIMQTSSQIMEYNEMLNR